MVGDVYKGTPYDGVPFQATGQSGGGGLGLSNLFETLAYLDKSRHHQKYEAAR